MSNQHNVDTREDDLEGALEDIGEAYSDLCNVFYAALLDASHGLKPGSSTLTRIYEALDCVIVSCETSATVLGIDLENPPC